MIHQKGSTLIIVLIVLLLVTIIGTIAVRSSILGLGIATNNQVNALLLENSDAALFNLENPNTVERQLATDGMYGYFSSASNASDELVFCYRAAESNFFSLQKSSAITPSNSTTKIGVAGFCTANAFATGRNAVLSQVYLAKATTTSSPFASVPKGSSLGAGSVAATSMTISATVVSVLPSFAAATSASIEACFKERASLVGACFAGLDIPYNIQHSDFTVGGQPKLIS